MANEEPSKGAETQVDSFEEPQKQKGQDDLQPQSWGAIGLCILVGLIGFYLFLVGLSMMGGSAKAMTGGGAAALFGLVEDPIAGLMVGILATVFVQSSSTSTSIVVALVSADAVAVKNAIPIIMGANIGTSVTNTIVSMAQSGNRLDLERSFAGATVHDMFNFMTVAILLPVEVIIGAMQGTGGPLYWLTHAITTGLESGNGGKPLGFESPTKVITKPVVNAFIKSNKYVIYALTLDKPESRTMSDTCAGVCTDGKKVCNTTKADEEGRRLDSVGDVYSRSLLNKRQLAEEAEATGPVDCSEYACVGSSLAKNYKKASKKAYAKLEAVSCEDAFGLDPCADESGSCYLGGSKYYEDEITNGRLISGGFLKGAGDGAGGVLGFIFALVFMSVGLIALCKSLQKIFMGQAKAVIRYSTKLNDYLAIAIGIGLTIIVQSSSVVTSALTPLCGAGVLPVKKMLPMTLGANIGTTMTAMIAALVDLKFNTLHIAFVHLFFNIIGILIFFPVPATRRIPLEAAKLLGLYASYYRYVPLIYIAVAFLALPAIFLAVSLSFRAHIVVGLLLVLIVCAALMVFEFWWWRGFGSAGPGAYKVLSKEERERGEEELVKANAHMMGITPEEYRATANELTWSGQ